MRSFLDRLRAADGLTLIEVMVGTLLLCGGLLGVLGVFNSSQRGSAGTARAQSAFEIAESTVEKLASVTTTAQWNNLGMDGTTLSYSGSTPNMYLRNGLGATGCLGTSTNKCTKLVIVQNPNGGTVTTPTGAETVSAQEALVTGGTVASSTTITNGPAGTIYEYVTSSSDQVVTVGSTTYTAKRITVAVDLSSDSSSSVNQPVWASTIVVDPTVTAQ